MEKTTLGACLVLLVLATSRPAGAEDKTKPLPHTRTSLVKAEGKVYTVEGRITIPRGVEITLQKGVIVRRTGSEKAVIEVAGSLVVHGISGTEVKFQGVQIEPLPKVQQLHLDMCKMESGSSVIAPKDRPTSGILTIENCDFSGSRVEIAATSGKVKLMTISSGSPVVLTGVDVGDRKCKAQASVRTCKLNGIKIENFADVTLRSNLLRSSPVQFTDNRVFMFDSNRVDAGAMTFRSTEPKGLKKLKFTKNDLFCLNITFFAPRVGKSRSRVILDKCYFGGTTDPDKIAEVIKDGEDDEANGTRVLVKKAMKRPHGLSVQEND